MPRVSAPEVVTGAREPRTAETVMQLPGPEVAPKVQTVQLADGEVHFVSKYREYAIVIATEPDRVNSSGEIVKGMNKAVRFRDFFLKTRDPIVVTKIRSLREFGLKRDVWEKWMQDQDLAQKALAMAEAAIDALPAEMQEEFAAKLAAKFQTFQLPPRTQPAEKAVAEKAVVADSTVGMRRGE